MVSELQAENNRLHRLFQKFSDESKALTIASVALICAALAVLLALMASNNATEARIRTEYQDDKITELRENYQAQIDKLDKEIRLYEYHIESLDAYLRANGINPPTIVSSPLPEK